MCPQEADVDILDTICKRRSIREYKQDPPKDAEIEKVLEAGRWAPSGLNNQPWRFLVMKDRLKKDGLAEFTKYGQIIKKAPVVIVVCMDVADSYNRDKDLMAIGASIQNMLLQAHSLGIGTCWLGEILNKKEQVAKFLKLNSDLELMAVISIGYPAKNISKGHRRSLQDVMIM